MPEILDAIIADDDTMLEKGVEDLGLPNAEDLKTNAEAISRIAQSIEEQGLTGQRVSDLLAAASLHLNGEQFRNIIKELEEKLATVTDAEEVSSGSSFEDFLEEQGTLEETTERALKRVRDRKEF